MFEFRITEQIVEVWQGNKLIATISPTEQGLKVTGEYIADNSLRAVVIEESAIRIRLK